MYGPDFVIIFVDWVIDPKLVCVTAGGGTALYWQITGALHGDCIAK